MSQGFKGVLLPPSLNSHASLPSLLFSLTSLSLTVQSSRQLPHEQPSAQLRLFSSSTNSNRLLPVLHGQQAAATGLAPSPGSNNCFFVCPKQQQAAVTQPTQLPPPFLCSTPPQQSPIPSPISSSPYESSPLFSNLFSSF